jgi:hypothetical protein
MKKVFSLLVLVLATVSTYAQSWQGKEPGETDFNSSTVVYARLTTNLNIEKPNFVIGAFIDDCSLFSSVNSKADDEALGELLDEAVDLFNDLKDKVNFKGEGAKGAYYASIRKELLEKTDALYAKLSEVVKKAGQTE